MNTIIITKILRIVVVVGEEMGIYKEVRSFSRRQGKLASRYIR
jgi:hypothetical protein